MRRKKADSPPTRIYSYGCRAPIDGREVLDDQLRMAHRYRNKLVEIELKRREEVALVQQNTDGLSQLLRVIDALKERIEEVKSAAKAAKTGHGKKVNVASYRAEIGVLNHDLKVMYAIRYFTKLALKADMKSAYKPTEENFKAALKVLRAQEDTPYWGTYLVLEKAAEAWRGSPEPPKFTRYTGSGRVAVQLQGGLTVQEAFSGEDTRLRILPGTPRVRKDGSLAPVRPEFQTVKIRVASDETGKPIWATFPFVMHRPLPVTGRIMWAWILRRCDGRQERYDLQLTVEAEEWRNPEAKGHGTIAIDIGTRDLPDGKLRVAMWKDDRGDSGEVCCQETRLSSPTSCGKGRRRRVPIDNRKLEDLQSIRSKRLDDAKLLVISMRANAPEWYREATSHAHNWGSIGRIIKLLREMRKALDPNVEPPMSMTFAMGWGAIGLAYYLDHDAHLARWHHNQSRRDQLRRREQYRVWAARLVERYSTIVVADRDYTRKKSEPEEGVPSEGRESRKMMRSAAPGELQQIIKLAAAARGAKFVKTELDGDTSWALDLRVCDRLLASMTEVPAEASPLASVHTDERKAKPNRARRLGNPVKNDPLAKEDVSYGRDFG